MCQTYLSNISGKLFIPNNIVEIGNIIFVSRYSTYMLLKVT